MPKRRNPLYEVHYSAWPNGKNHWYISGYANGKRRQLWYRDEEKAKAAADDLNEEIVAFGTQAALPSNLRLMAVNCANRLSAVGKTLDDATNHYLKYLEQTVSAISVNDLANQAETFYANRGKNKPKKKKHADRIASVARRLRQRFGEVKAEVIKPHQLRNWIDHFKNEKGQFLSGTTKNSFRAGLSVIWQYGKVRGLVQSNPVEQIQKFEEDNEDEQISILSVEQTTILLKKADQEIIPFLAIAMFAGVRRAELERLDWSAINLEKGHIEIKKDVAKTGSRRFIDISENLKPWLLPFKIERGSLLPLSTLRRTKGQPSLQRLRDLLESSTKAAGIIPWPRNCMRHSFGSYRMALTDDPKKVASEMGHHDSGVTFGFYRELVHRSEAKKYFGLTPSMCKRAFTFPTA